jgi:phage tail sheath protein FI
MTVFVTTGKMPNVYPVEQEQGTRPITDLDSTVCGFIGLAEKGPVGTPTPITSFGQFVRKFGGKFTSGGTNYFNLYYGVYLFFLNGGSKCYIVRTAHHSGSAYSTVAANVMVEDGSAHDSVEVEASSPGVWADSYQILTQQCNAAIPALCALTNEMVTDYEAHRILTAGSVHLAADTTNTMTSTTDISTLAGAIVQLNDLKTQYEAHRALLTAHTNDDDVNTISASDATEIKSAITLANELRIDLAAHFIQLVDLGSNPVHGNPVHGAADTTQTIANSAVTTNYQIQVLDADSNLLETWDDLSHTSTDSRYAETVINGYSAYITVDVQSATYLPEYTTQDLSTTTSGNDGLTSLDDTDYYGVEANESGLWAFAGYESEIFTFVIPGLALTMAYLAAVTTFANTQNYKRVMMIADVAQNSTPSTVESLAAGMSEQTAVTYYPWVKITDPDSLADATVPPSGAMAGCWARVDRTRGVHKVAAGFGLSGDDGVIYGAWDVERRLTETECGTLNDLGVNCIRMPVSQGKRIPTAWGARTLSTHKHFKSLPVRRTVSMMHREVNEGIAWALFEPINEDLMRLVREDVREYLRGMWEAGALQGATEEEAFSVVCDTSNNPPSVTNQFIMYVDVGVAVSKPAEYIPFRVTMDYSKITKSEELAGNY